MMNHTSGILSLLGEGKKNARSAAELAALVGTDERNIRKAISAARIGGALICSGVPGYWLPGSRAELVECYKKIHSQAVSTLAALQPMGEALNREQGANDGV